MDTTTTTIGADYMASRAADLTDLYRRIDNPPEDAWEDEEAREELDSFGLSIERTTTLRYVFGTGGPHDEIRWDVEQTGHGWERVGSVTYYYGTWFGQDAHEEIVDDDHPFTRLADEVTETYLG